MYMSHFFQFCLQIFIFYNLLGYSPTELGNIFEVNLFTFKMWPFIITCWKFTCVHGEDLIKSKKFSDIFLVLSKNIVVECSWGQGQRRGLISQGFDDLGVGMTLVHCTVSTEEIVVAVAIHIPHKHACNVILKFLWKLNQRLCES